MTIRIEGRSRWAQPLRRSLHRRVVAGVCGGLAEWLGWEVSIVRMAFLALALFTNAFAVVIAYLLLALLVPEDRPYLAYLRFREDLER
jgi:phage shock protein PspC (stress-responsive transcriptional regulator)